MLSRALHRSPPLNLSLPNVLLAAAVLAGLNAGFVAASLATGVQRPLVNIDYALALALCAAGAPALGVALGAVFMLTDALALVCQLFPFPRLSDLVYLLRFTTLASPLHGLLLGLGLVVLVLKLTGLLKLSRRIAPLSALLILNALLVLAALLMQTADPDSRFTQFRSAGNLAVASQSYTLASMRDSPFLEHFEGDDQPFQAAAAGATQPWFEPGAQATGQRLLLVVVESWGVARRPDIERALLAPLAALPHATMTQGSLPFDGFTIGGELRELCQLAPQHFNLRDVTQGFEPCLPNRLRAAGYQTAALHGATGLMYDRRYWYPRVGFEQMTFFEDRRWPRRCYSFPGACDLDMAAELPKYFSQPGKRFMYWLTLNSHSPYDLRDLRGPEGSRLNCAAFGMAVDTESCRALTLQADFFAGLAQQLRTEAMKGVDIIIVGDHPPKLMNLQEKADNFSNASVPWIRIKT